MDATTARLIDFAAGLDYARLPENTVHECKRRLIDAIGCAIGAYDDHLSVMARAMAGRVRGDPAASILGSKVSTSPEAAAFTNGVMIRLADISDTYLGKARGHPSDMLSGILAVGETVQANGQAIIAATTLAYDIYCSLCDALTENFLKRQWMPCGKRIDELGCTEILPANASMQRSQDGRLAVTPRSLEEHNGA